MFCIHRRRRSSVSFLRAWMIRGGRLGTKLYMLGPNGEVYTGFHLYSLGDGYTNVQRGLSGSSTPGEKPRRHREMKQERETGEKGNEWENVKRKAGWIPGR